MLNSKSRTKAWSMKLHNQNEYEISGKKIYNLSTHSVTNTWGKQTFISP